MHCQQQSGPLAARPLGTWSGFHRQRSAASSTKKDCKLQHFTYIGHNHSIAKSCNQPKEHHRKGGDKHSLQQLCVPCWAGLGAQLCRQRPFGQMAEHGREVCRSVTWRRHMLTLNPHSSNTSMLPAKAATRCWKAALLRRILLNLSCSGSRYTFAKYFCMVWKQVVTPVLLSE